MLFAARGLGAILSAATMPTTMAYVSDSTSEQDRGGGIGVLGAATGLGMVLGPALGGWLAVDSLSTPFFLTAGVCLLTLLLVWLFLPESLPGEARQPAADQDPPGRSASARCGGPCHSPTGRAALDGFPGELWVDLLSGDLWPLCPGAVWLWPERGRLDPGGHGHRGRGHPGCADRAADQTLGRGGCHQGHAAGQRGWLWVAADGGQPGQRCC